jgi:arabinofuranosyltransferase
MVGTSKQSVHNWASTRHSVAAWVAVHWKALAFAGIIVLFLANAFTYFGWGQDDPGILFRYAVNLAEGRGLVYNPGERVEGFSDFGYVILMSVAYKALGLAGRPEILFVVSKFVGLACSIIALGLTYKIAIRFLRFEPPWALFACLLLAASAPFAIWSVGGLETNCLVCVLLASLYAYLRYLQERQRQPATSDVLRLSFLCGIGLALLTLLRADAFVFVLILATHWFFARMQSRDVRRFDWPVLLLPIVTTLVYELWRLWYYGRPLPNTYYAKVAPSLSPQVIAQAYQGYVEPYLNTLGGAGLVIGLVAVALYKDERLAPRFLGFFSGAYVAYVLIVGGDWMAGYRFLVPVVPLLLLLMIDGGRHVIGVLRLHLRKSQSAVALSVCIALLIAAQQAYEGMGMIQEWKNPFTPWYRDPTFDAKRLVPYGDISAWVEEHTEGSALLATHQAGFIPLLSGLRTIDTFGITNETIAQMGTGGYGMDMNRAGRWYALDRAPASTPPQRYIVEQKPDLYVIYSRWNRKFTNTARYLAGGEYVLLESNLYGYDVYMPAAGTDKVLLNLAAFGGASTTYNSAYDPSDTAGDVFRGGTWTSGCNDAAWIQTTFEATHVVDRIAIEVAGTDITTEGSLIELTLLDTNDISVTVATLKETNINWARASDGEALNSLPEYRLDLPQPVTARAFRLSFTGHGWFFAKNIRVLGRATPG